MTPSDVERLPTRIFERLSGTVTDFFRLTGEFALNVRTSFAYLFRGEVDRRKVVEQIAAIGYDSLPVALLICLIAGSVLALQTADAFAQSGADAYVGGLVALAITREIAPIFASLAVGARAGTAIAAEIANMKVTEQVDALRVMHVDPVRYLFLPRLLATMLSLPLISLMGATLGIVGGMFVARGVTGLHYSKYIESIWLTLDRYDIGTSMLKAAIFGLIVAGVSGTIGLDTRGGAKDVGRATTKSVVWVAIAIIVCDFFLTWILFGSSYSG